MDQQQKEPLPEGPAVPYPSGVWVGYWQVGGRQWPMSVLLEFFPTAFTGTGEDSCGLFRVIGTYGALAHEVNWIKSYGTHNVQYGGFYDPEQRCLTGKFRCGFGGGHFWLWEPGASQFGL